MVERAEDPLTIETTPAGRLVPPAVVVRSAPVIPIDPRRAAQIDAEAHPLPHVEQAIVAEIWSSFRTGGIGLTVDELAVRLQQEVSSIAPRVFKLVHKDKQLSDSGKRRPTRRGKLATVWTPSSTAVEHGS